MQTENKKFNLWQKFSAKASEFIRLDKTKSTARKVSSSLWSLFFGILIAFAYIVVKKGVQSSIFVNPIEIITTVLKSFNSSNKYKILQYFLVFGFSSIACALSFKAGLFNIGIPGQMMISGFVSFALIIRYGATEYQETPTWLLVIALFISIIFAFAIGLVAGALKAYLNVHEVISTIMINWIIVGLSMLIFQQSSASIVWPNFSSAHLKYYFADNLQGTNAAFTNISTNVKMAFFIVGIVALLALSIGITFIFNFTNLGYKIRMQGISKSNGKYMGVNDKLLTVMVLGVSSAISAIAGFYFYVIGEGFFLGITQPLNLGFEAIAISLLALNSPVGALFSSLFYTYIYTSGPSLQLAPLYIQPEDLQVITSVILYLAATSIMFLQFKPINFSVRKVLLLLDPRYLKYRKLEQLLVKKASLIAQYNAKIYGLEQNSNSQNYQSSISKLAKIQDTYTAKFTKLNNAIELAKFNCQKANELYQIQLELFAAKKDNNAQLMSDIKANITKFKQQWKTKKMQFKPSNSAPSEIRSDIKLNNTENSFKLQIKQLRKQLTQITNEYLTNAMNYKNSDDQTIAYFENINGEKMKINYQLMTLGVGVKFKLKQQRKAQIKDIKSEHNDTYEMIISQRKQMHICPFRKRKEA
ncbi:Sugar ABC transporter Permease [Mycoplasmopsis bovigenitalium 51080]|uniref:Sugar ABC transporter Permease n=1 Tax=Mycoplasmopsis bovigenitalium 51080 TaxID=1188235 RepID=N9TTK9_9BACT|nr:ABC transporter permease [Mycoplasmopsis bovigenitalium]ENY69479.1 Sugar ABC transporter Permease [Mycoplasmopsis bovigenitalium 51080]